MARRRSVYATGKALETRALVAYNCGRRLAVEHADEVMSCIELELGVSHLLTPMELVARRESLPASWLAHWWHGWHDGLAAADTEGGGE